jgi:hypothetical protein
LVVRNGFRQPKMVTAAAGTVEKAQGHDGRSAGTRAVALTRRGPKVQVTVAEDGVPGPEDVRHVLSPRGRR